MKIKKSLLIKIIKEEILKERFEPNRNNTGLTTYGPSKTFIAFHDPSGRREYKPTEDELELWSLADGKIKDILARMWYPKSELDTNVSGYYPED